MREFPDFLYKMYCLFKGEIQTKSPVISLLNLFSIFFLYIDFTFRVSDRVP